MKQLILSETSFELVGVAKNADEAIELACLHRPDVALIDFKMPAGGGPRAVREIGARSPETRVLALSAYGDDGSVDQMLRAGAAGYLVKGASVEEILEALDRFRPGSGPPSR